MARERTARQRDAAVEAGREATRQRDAALRLAERMRRTSYVSDMGLAWAAVDGGKPSYVRGLLDRHRPGPGQADLRSLA